MWRSLGRCVLAIGVVVGCAAPASTRPSTTIASDPPAARTPAPARATPSSPALETAAASLTVPVDLASILAVDKAERFETFGGEPIRLEAVWSPPDLGLGGTCLPSDSWLECGLQDWVIQPSQEYDGPRLDLFYAQGVRERLGRSLEPGEGPFDVIGNFGDPAAEDCQPANQDECRDQFVVTAIELGA